jgi:hypothetical protein
MSDKKIKRSFIITEKAWNTMQQYARIAYDTDKNEISGLVHLKRVEHPTSGKKVWELFDPIILKQENTGTSTELDGEVLRDYYVKAGMKYGTNVRLCWWHSHHTMAAFWSGTDIREINAWKNDSWSLALVINLYGEYKLNVATWDPIEHDEDVPLEILHSIPNPTKKQLKEYEELCSNPALVQIHTATEPLAKTEKLMWKTSDNIEDYAELYEDVIDKVNDIATDIAAGDLKYDKYSEAVDSINKCLKTRNAKIQLIKLKKGTLLEKSMTMTPFQHIKYDDKVTEDVYENTLALIDVDMPIGGNYYV